MFDKIEFPQDTIFYAGSVDSDNPGILWQIKKSSNSIDVIPQGPMIGKTTDEQIAFINDFDIKGGVFFTSEKKVITKEEILNGIL